MNWAEYYNLRLKNQQFRKGDLVKKSTLLLDLARDDVEDRELMLRP